MAEPVDIRRTHILLRHSTRKPYCEVPELPEGSVYDDEFGLWRLQDGGTLVNDATFAQKQTKKCDQETGEDQKGT
jgi:hypothetical protein